LTVAQKWMPRSFLIFAGNQLAASKHFDSRICIPHKFCSRNGLDEVQAMDLSAALHRVSPPLPSHALHSILPLPSHAVHFFFINSMDAGILHIPLSKVPEWNFTQHRVPQAYGGCIQGISSHFVVNITAQSI
jgi:hypothetical protein